MGEKTHGWLPGLAPLFRRERILPLSVLTMLAFVAFGDRLSSLLEHPVGLAILFLWLFFIVLASAMSVSRHGEHLADRLGEPYGTLILTLVVTTIEVVAISAVMFHGDNNPTLVRDTLFAVIMIILNGMVGISLLLGAWRRLEQRHNLQGANTYLGLIVPLACLSLILPEFTTSPSGPALSPLHQRVLILTSVGLYVTFLLLQTGRNRVYFSYRSAQAGEEREDPDRSLVQHIVLLFAYLVPVVYLVEHLAKPIDHVIETMHAPLAFGGVIMAVLVATPEAVGAARAAVANNLQRSINIFLGSVLSTIGLTVPAMLIISRISGHPIILGLGRTEMIMLVLTLAVSMITFSSGRTNLLQGAVHLTLFATYLMLVVAG